MSVFLGAVFFLAGAVGVVTFRRSPRLADRIFRFSLLAGAGLTVVPAFAILGGAPPVAVAFPATLPGGPWAVGLDALSAWFLLVIAGVGAVTGLFGVSYLSHERPDRAVASAHATFALLLTAMIGVVVARAAVPFLLAWEFMAISAYLLIVFEGEKKEVHRAGLVYLVLTHAGTLALFAMFLAWGRAAPDLTFQSLAAASPGLASGGTLVLGLALVGFGVKAGMVPMHFWLPGAHAAAPSHVSAVLSGVMIKTGIYGLLRMLNLLGGAPPAWWGWALLVLGLGSALLGVLWALGQHDLKRVLAYSTVENAGIILLAMGVGALGLTYQQPVLALLGLTGAVLHILNHALFKSLLFLGAGAVLRVTGTRNLDRLGGLAPRMPWTVLAFTVGSIAIAGLPPLNGFVGEWVVFQSLLHAGLAEGSVRILVLVGAAIGLVGALSVACFTRVTGVVFLGQARSPEAAGGREVGWGMLVPMFVLASGCVILGLIPFVVVPAAVRVAGLVLGLPLSAAGNTAADLGHASRGLTALAVGVAAIVALLWAGRRYSRAAQQPAQAATWSCAYDSPSSRMQYTASSYGTPILAVFKAVAGPQERRGPTRFATDPQDRILARLITPLWSRVTAVAGSLRPLQQGRLTQYLQYIILTVLVLLALLFASMRAGR